MENIGRVLILFGILTVLLGLALTLGSKIPFLGQLPGDFSFKLGPAQVYLPLATSILLSIVLTVVLNLILNFWRR